MPVSAKRAVESRYLVAVPEAIIDSLGDMAFRLSRDGVILEYHASDPDQLYRPPDAFLGKSVRETMPPDVAEMSLFHLAKTLETGCVQFHEYQLAFAAEDVRSYEARTAPDGLGGVFVVVRDITERKRAEQALRESESMYRSLFENMMNGFAHCRMIRDGDRPVDFVYLSVNAAFEATTGLRGVVGKRVSEVIPGIRETDPELFEIYGRVARSGKPESFEMFVSALDMWFAISVYSPSYDHFVAVFDVVTERKRTEAALRQSEARLHDVIFSMADWVWELDAHGAYTYSSPKVFDYFGLTPDEVIGQTPFDFMPPDEAVRVARIFAEAAANKAPLRDVENWNILKDGRRVCFMTNGLPVLDAQGNLVGYRGVDKDITERKRAEVLMKARIDLSERLVDADTDTLLQQTLDHAELLTGSNIGFFHFVDPDQQNLTL
ncbi:MAG: PAS domain-containing protein, partial [Deltaproteobacteria bacterium]|nr:PAS domain-containing protein [Deltaproteobacteria bacterium]